MGPISEFIKHNFRHFNAASLVDAAEAFKEQKARGNRMMLAMAGAMSTAELGISLAKMIRAGQFDIICCTANNLEEDIFNLVAHDFYKRVPGYRSLTAADEAALLAQHMNRVTDTCIPEEEAIRRIEHEIFGIWKGHCDTWKKTGQEFCRRYPHEFIYELVYGGRLKKYYQIDPENSWVLAAAEKNLPIVIGGWEDCTLGNIFTAHCLKGELDPRIMMSGIEYMMFLADWYVSVTTSESLGILTTGIPSKSEVGFFQIGGGIAGDFPICVVPMLQQDMRIDVPVWSYFAQISDSTTSYGSYSGAVPNEKITWGKLGVNTPKFVIESDATIVAPLIFAYVLGE